MNIKSFKGVLYDKNYYFKLLVLFLPLFLVYYLIHNIIGALNLSNVLTQFTGYFFEALILQFVIIISLLLIHQLKSKKSNSLAASVKILSAVFDELSKNILPLLKISSLKLVLIFAGMIVLVLPGFHLSAVWFPVYPLFLFNRSKHPFKESLELIDKYIFNVYGLLILYYLVLVLVPGMIIQIFRVTPYNYQKMFYYSSMLIIPLFCFLQYNVWSFIIHNAKKKK